MAGMYRALIILLFLSTIVAANIAVSELDPVSVGFGIVAPAGVYLVALTLALRDLVQRLSGVWGVSIAGVGGITLSFLLADPAVVWASVLAFTASFLIDTAIFTWLWYTLPGNGRDHTDDRTMAQCVFLSGMVSLIPDTLIFCYVAGFPEFIPGQLLGKMYGTIAYSAVLFFIAWRVQRSYAVTRK